MPKPLTVLYDSQMFNLQKYGGITRYFSNLVTGINKRDGIKAHLPLALTENYYVRYFPQLFNNPIGRFLLKTNKKKYMANLMLSKFNIIKGDYDILHATYYDPYFLNSLRKPLVITVHDMIHENYTHLYNQAEEIITQKKKMIDAADLVIAISEYTKQEILKYYPQHSNKIKVIYHGLPENHLKPSSEELPNQFLLYIGDRTASYKNFGNMIRAIASILIKDQDLRLICAGGGEFSDAELALFHELRVFPQIIQINAPDSLVKQLYMQALIFIYPSLEEGFGLPMLEAFKNGCPIACSNKSCLPEVGGNAAAYFNPEDQSSVAHTVSQLIGDTDLRNKLTNLGYDQLKKFTFENCLNQTIESYQSLVENTPLTKQYE